MPLTDTQRLTLQQAWRGALSRIDPAWTDGNASDPGLTLLELLAYALEDLAATRSASGPAVHALAQRIAAAAGRLAGAGEASEEGCGGGALARVRYAEGQLLGVEDFRAEQAYFRARLRRHNRLMHGVGVVTGLEVSVEPSANGASVRVSPGLALDPTGEEIHVVDAAELPLNGPECALFVLVRYAERPCDPRPRIALNDDDSHYEASRVADTFALSLSPAAAADAVALARLVRQGGQWGADPGFEVPRAR